MYSLDYKGQSMRSCSMLYSGVIELLSDACLVAIKAVVCISISQSLPTETSNPHNNAMGAEMEHVVVNCLITT